MPTVELEDIARKAQEELRERKRKSQIRRESVQEEETRSSQVAEESAPVPVPQRVSTAGTRRSRLSEMERGSGYFPSKTKTKVICAKCNKPFYSASGTSTECVVCRGSGAKASHTQRKGTRKTCRVCGHTFISASGRSDACMECR